jgi:hypothetical protein
MKGTECVILFFTSNHAIRAEKLLGRAQLPCRLTPVPRHLSSDCGVCVRIDCGDRDAAERLLAAQRVEFEATHPVA